MHGHAIIVYYVPDVCHMLKLARNALCDVKIFVDNENRSIKWDYIEFLYKIQSQFLAEVYFKIQELLFNKY